MSKYSRSYYLKNREKIRSQQASYYKRHPEVMKRTSIAWAKANPDRVKKNRRLSVQRRMAINPAFKISKTSRTRVYKALKSKGIHKSKKTFDLIGCSVEHLKRHIESKFVQGMCWENYGPVWHIDHILPCASFDLTKQDEQHKCFHYTNLQPLFALDNLRKKDKIQIYIRDLTK